MNKDCPNCGKSIKVYEDFIDVSTQGINASEFFYNCEHCGTLLKVEVDLTPIFNISVVEKQGQ